jgi:hypothetical protein
LRSGRIITAVAPSSQWDVDESNLLDGCMAAPECVAWRLSGCSPSLAGRNPGIHASIVDVADLADGTTVRGFGFASDGPVLDWGWVTVEFGSADCLPIGARRRLDSSRCWAAGCSRGVVIPENARWMTITSRQDNINIVWTLT